jgi:hypothetical protein
MVIASLVHHPGHRLRVLDVNMSPVLSVLPRLIHDSRPLAMFARRFTSDSRERVCMAISRTFALLFGLHTLLPTLVSEIQTTHQQVERGLKALAHCYEADPNILLVIESLRLEWQTLTTLIIND